MVVDQPTFSTYIDKAVEKPEFSEILKKLGRTANICGYVAENRLTEADTYLRGCDLKQKQRDRLIKVAQQSFEYLQEISQQS